HLPLPVARVPGPDRVGDARGDVAAGQHLLDLLHGAVHRGELEEDVHAVLVLLDHALDALHLALDAAQPAEGLALGVLVEHVGHCLPSERWGGPPAVGAAAVATRAAAAGAASGARARSTLTIQY